MASGFVVRSCCSPMSASRRESSRATRASRPSSRSRSWKPPISWAARARSATPCLSKACAASATTGPTLAGSRSVRVTSRISTTRLRTAASARSLRSTATLSGWSSVLATAKSSSGPGARLSWPTSSATSGAPTFGSSASAANMRPSAGSALASLEARKVATASG